MKNLIKIGSGILAMGVLMTTGITVFATSDTDANMDVNSANTLISEESTNRRSMGRCNGGFGNMERPELTEDQKAEMEENMKERLAEQLEDGNITQEEYDQAISDIAEGKRPMFLGRGGFGNMERPELTEEQKAEMEENMKERLAEQLEDGNITQEEYDQAISDIAEGKRPMFSGRGRGGFCNMERRDFIGDKK
ncbi:MAG: hypothetical protein ACTHWZ_01980 [Peptoniphilaceae bacterium]